MRGSQNVNWASTLGRPLAALFHSGSLQPRRSGHVEQFSGHRRQTCHTFAPQHGRWPAAVVAPHWLCQPQKFVTRHAATPHLERQRTHTPTHTQPESFTRLLGEYKDPHIHLPKQEQKRFICRIVSLFNVGVIICCGLNES